MLRAVKTDVSISWKQVSGSTGEIAIKLSPSAVLWREIKRIIAYTVRKKYLVWKGVDHEVLKNYRVPNYKGNHENNIIERTENGKKYHCAVSRVGDKMIRDSNLL